MFASVLQIMAAVGLTGWLSFLNAQKSVKDLVNQIGDEVATGVEHHIKTFAHTPYQFLQINVSAIRSDYFDLNDYTAMGRYFWEQIQISEAVPYIYFGNPQGNFLGVWRETEELTTLRIRNQQTAPHREIYQLDPQGNRQTLISNTDLYDPRERPWYQIAVQTGELTWSSIYVFANPQRLGITQAVPIYDDSTLLGVLAVDLTLSNISQFLGQLDIGASGQVFIIERSGDIVASSLSEPPFQTKGGEEIRITAVQSEHPLIREASQHLLNRFQHFDRVVNSERFTFDIKDRPHFLQVTPIQDGRGLDWLMVAVLPLSDFSEQIASNKRNTMILCAIALLVATLSGIVTSRWITSPVVRIARASDLLAQGELDLQISPSRIAEIDALALSFNRMASALMSSFDERHKSWTTNRAIIETIPDLIIRAKADGTYLDIFGNDRPQRINGVNQIGNGSTVWESLPSALAKKRMHYIQKALETGQLQIYEHQILLDRQLHDEEVRILVLGDDEVLIIVRDISARKQAEKALEQANQILEKKVAERTASLAESQSLLEANNQELREALETLKTTQVELQNAKERAESANRSKSEFLANMSHELRTPLNSIIGFTQILSKDRSVKPEQQQRLNIINRSGEHLLSLINNILEMSKIEAGRITLYNKYFDLHSVLQDMQGMFCLKLQEKGLKFLLDIDSSVPHYIFGDEGKFRQILINLIGNAVKFTERGTIALRASSISSDNVDVHLEKNYSSHQSVLFIEVEDSGPGIPHQELDRLFIPFEQTSAGHKLKQGTGLGLSITDKFVNLMGGEITVNSTVEVGTCFQVSIPIEPTANEGLPCRPTRGKVIGLKPDQPSYRILVVDDEPDNCLVLLDLLTPIGFAVRQANNGREATDIWREWRPHLIWMDLRMPEMDGYRATQLIRELEVERKTDAATNKTVIIALTASALVEKGDLVKTVGFDGYAIKPFREETIWEAMHQHLGVEYIYQQPPESPTQPLQPLIGEVSPSTDDVFASLNEMPTDWLAELHQASSQLRGKQVLQLIKAIPSEKSAMARKLQTLAENYQFDEIVRLLNAD